MPAPAYLLVGASLGVLALVIAYLGYRARHSVQHLQEVAHAAAAGETRFRALLEAAPDALITVDHEGRILIVNSQTEVLFGYTREELVGTPIEGLLPDRLRERHVEHRRQFNAQPRRRPMGLGMDLAARRKDGSEFATEISLSPLHTDEGAAIIVVVRDITDRKRAEVERAALERAQAARVEAEAANRAKDEFVAMVSHELRTPLNAMLGWAVMLRTKQLDEEVAQRALEAIERNARVQRQVIDDLLDVSRMITGKVSLEVEPADVAEIVAAAVDSVRPATEARQIRLEVTTDANLPPILADPARLQQALLNLLSNAIKFTPEKGEIRVSARATRSEVELLVADNGNGIDPDLIPRIFDRFRQSDSSSTRTHGGLGLGLAIVRQLVELHGGTVEASSAGEGAGSTFKIALPVPAVFLHGARRPSPAGLEAAATEAETPDLRGIDVLVVDDDGETRDLVRAVLAAAGARVTTVSSAFEALMELSEHVPDVLMSDIAMPQCDGYELMRRVREQHHDVPSIALTAYGSAEDRDRAVAAGFERHIAKPVFPQDLVTVVAKTARRQRGGSYVS